MYIYIYIYTYIYVCVCVYNGIVFSHKKMKNVNCSNMDGHRDYYTK